MPLVRRLLAWTAVALAAAILVLFAMPSYRQGEASIAGKPAQDFSLTLAGKSERLSDLKGKIGGPQLLGHLVPALRRGNSVAQSPAKIYRFARWNGFGRQRR